MDDLDPLLSLAERLALGAAELLLDALTQGGVRSSTKTSLTDLVTDADEASERLIVEGLLRDRPHDGIRGEEGTEVVGTSGIEWVVDPIDGTTNFVYGHSGFGVSIAALVDGEPIVGVVADPLHDDLFTATRGGGARRNHAPIRGTGLDRLDLALVATGFSYLPERRRLQAEVLTHVLPEVRDIRRMGGAAVDLCSAACGRVDAFYERGLNPWDFAAGWLVAAEAGLRVGDLDGGPPSSEFALAAPAGIFDELAALLRRAGAGAA
ncbi:MAG TPA: inositol monophosphatase family protein [Acidimicrobiales bacterium]|nr:inositol monophosphatase family protein [Acidimicrobiales bacterium]